MKASAVKWLLQRPINYRWVAAITPNGSNVAGFVVSFNFTTLMVRVQRVGGGKDFFTHIDNIRYR